MGAKSSLMAAQANEANNATDETPAKAVPLHALRLAFLYAGKEMIPISRCEVWSDTPRFLRKIRVKDLDCIPHLCSVERHSIFDAWLGILRTLSSIDPQM